MFEIIFDIEKHYGLEISSDDFKEWRTFGDLVDCVVDYTGTQRRDGPLPQETVEAYLRNLLMEKYWVKEDAINRDAELYGPELILG
jgi:hypothetical protein